MSAPQFESTDVYDLLSLVADAGRPVGNADESAFLDACRRDAMANDGLVSVNRVRELMSARDIEHHRYSAFWSRFTGKDRPMVKAFTLGADGERVPIWETCKGSPTGNDGRPFAVRRWVGESA